MNVLFPVWNVEKKEEKIDPITRFAKLLIFEGYITKTTISITKQEMHFKII